jgi:hypothetical protein
VTPASIARKQLLLTTISGGNSNTDLATIVPDGKAAPNGLVRTPPPNREFNGRFSPDGRWFAYQSNESGRNEIFVQAFPTSGGKWQVSTAGGNAPMWRADGKEIVYQGPDDTFFAVDIKATGAAFEIGTPVRLFQRRVAHNQFERNSWAMARDSQRFLLIVPIEDSNPRSIQIVQNWAAGLKKQ